MKLTKNRLKKLELALSMDDVLHEKFRRLNEDLQKEWQKLYRAKRIVKVLQRQGSVNLVLQIEEMQVGPEGTIVICRGGREQAPTPQRKKRRDANEHDYQSNA